MKKHICIIAALAMVVLSYERALAVFKGQLRSDVRYTVTVKPNHLNANATAVTLTYVDSRGRLDVAALLTVLPGEVGTLESLRIPDRTNRIIIDVDMPNGGSGVVTVTQGLTLFEDPIGEDARFVYDVVESR